MSLNSLASSRVARELGRRSALEAASEDTASGSEKDVQNALSALVEYVPAETITLYLAVMAALTTLQAAFPIVTSARVYWAFVALTPILFALIYAGKRRAERQSRWPGLRHWPWWPTLAATIAFATWALTPPNRPYFLGDSGGVMVGLLAIIVSILLGVIARVVGSPKVS